MTLSVYLVLFTIIASVTIFFVARRRTSLGKAAALSALTFLGISAALIAWLQVALRTMNG